MEGITALSTTTQHKTNNDQQLLCYLPNQFAIASAPHNINDQNMKFFCTLVRCIMCTRNLKKRNNPGRKVNPATTDVADVMFKILCHFTGSSKTKISAVKIGKDYML
jgi:hypothetical protein